MPAPTNTPPARASGCCLNPNCCRCSLPCLQRELGTASGGADSGGRERGRLFLAPAKISKEASCSVIHLQGQGFLHHNRMLVVIPACVCAHVYIYIHMHRGVYTVHTQGHSVHTGVRTPLVLRRWHGCPATRSHSPCRSHPGHWSHGTAPQHVYCCTSAAHASEGSRHTALQPGGWPQGRICPGAQPAPSTVQGAGAALSLGMHRAGRAGSMARGVAFSHILG